MKVRNMLNKYYFLVSVTHVIGDALRMSTLTGLLELTLNKRGKSGLFMKYSIVEERMPYKRPA